MLWKYAMILVDVNSTDPDNIVETCELVELYSLEGSGYFSFCKANLLSIDDLKAAAEDVLADGVNRWFYENGKFSLETDKVSGKSWNWEAEKPLDKALIDCGDIETYEDEIELYTIYGGD